GAAAGSEDARAVLSLPDPLDAGPAGPEGPDEHGVRSGGAGALLRSSPGGIRVERALVDEELRRAGKGAAAAGRVGSASGGCADAAQKPFSENPQSRVSGSGAKRGLAPDRGSVLSPPGNPSCGGNPPLRQSQGSRAAASPVVRPADERAPVVCLFHPAGCLDEGVRRGDPLKAVDYPDSLSPLFGEAFLWAH